VCDDEVTSHAFTHPTIPHHAAIMWRIIGSNSWPGLRAWLHAAIPGQERIWLQAKLAHTQCVSILGWHPSLLCATATSIVVVVAACGLLNCLEWHNECDTRGVFNNPNTTQHNNTCLADGKHCTQFRIRSCMPSTNSLPYRTTHNTAVERVLHNTSYESGGISARTLS
jgi:hypothetical protein